MEFLISDEQIELLLTDLVDTYGYDFTAYTKASLKRRVNRLYALDLFPSFAEFRYRIRMDETYFSRFIEQVTVNVTEMFRDPSFFLFLRNQILPVLATYPFIRIWHAGCSTGEEPFSMAIMLEEANLLHKSIIYATDINPFVVKKAAEGIFSIRQMQKNSENYRLAGGKRDFSSYYSASYNQVIFNKELSKRMVFATHNLVSESSFNHFQLIICRNVLIYFEKELQGRVFELFDESLDKLGFIALGSKENLRIFQGVNRYSQQAKEKIWRKIS